MPDGLVKHTLQIPLRQGRTLKVLMRSDLLGHDQGLVVRDGLHPLGAQALEGGGVFSQIKLGADEDDGDRWGVMVDLGKPLDKYLSGL